MYHRVLSHTLSELRYHNIVKYGPDEQGRRNKLTTIHTTNAHHGEVTLSMIDIILGLRESGTSITKNFLYRK